MPQQAAYRECVKVCRKIQVNCYFDCSRRANLKSPDVIQKYFSCTKICDEDLQKCHGNANTKPPAGCARSIVIVDTKNNRYQHNFTKT